MPITILPMRKVTAPIIVKDALHPFEPMKDLRPKKPLKKLYIRCGASGNPPPNGNDDSKICKKKLSPEQLAKIREACKDNNMSTKDYLKMMNYTKKF